MSRIIITLPQLAEAISRSTNISVPEAEKFVVSLVEEISAKLAEREFVEVPGLGVFAVGGLDDSTVVWKPSDELEQEVNAPFAFFEPVELADGVSEHDLNSEFDNDAVTEAKTGTAVVEEQNQDDFDSGFSETEDTVTDFQEDDENDCQEQTVVETVVETVSDNDIISDVDGFNDESSEEEPPEEEPRRGRFGWIELLLGLAMGLIIGFVAAIYTPNPQLTPLREALSGKSAGEKIESEADGDVSDGVEPVYSVAVDTAPVLKDTVSVSVQDMQNKVTDKNDLPSDRLDTVTSTRFLTTMARQYYGDYHFWIYIYMYNKDVIDNPDRIPAGTSVRIPDASVYGIDASSPQSIAKAQSLIESLKKGQ